MGLTIVAYSQLTPFDELNDASKRELTDGDCVNLKNPPKYAAHLAPLEPGCYFAQEDAREVIGGYGFYQEWREWLRRFANDGQFQVLLSFSDCDGFLGPFAVRDLASNFEAREEDLAPFLARTVSDEEQRLSYETTYRQFLSCFRKAGCNGVVAFT